MKVTLAPMQGLCDDILRDVLTGVGDFDGATSEFVRVSGTLLPHKMYRRLCPELDHGSRTAHGTPMAVQLLGSDPACMAENAAKLCQLSPAGLDLNFGCPAQIVNRHGGGATLLDTPDQLFAIASAVRAVVPDNIPFTAKMRLGVADTSKALDCARALEAGGAESLTVHARTKQDGYKPPAHWEWIARIQDVVRIPVIANGEIWTVEDYLRCRKVSGISDVMIGRGAVADPFLSRRIKRCASGGDAATPAHEDWQALQPIIAEYWRQAQGKLSPSHVAGRLKGWLAWLRRTYPEADHLHAAMRPVNDLKASTAILSRHGIPLGDALA